MHILDFVSLLLREAKISGFSTKTVGSWQMKVIVGDEEMAQVQHITIFLIN